MTDKVEGDLRDEIISKMSQQQEKLSYYVIALSVTCIGFSVLQTSAKQIELIQIPLAVAVLLWGVSILLGFLFIQNEINVSKANLNSTHSIARVNQFISKGESDKVKAKSIEIESALRILNKLIMRSMRFQKWQQRTFYIGIIGFLVWHVLGMYYQK